MIDRQQLDPDDSGGAAGAFGGNESPGADLALALATTALSLEGLAVATYDSAVQARDVGRLGEVPRCWSN